MCLKDSFELLSNLESLSVLDETFMKNYYDEHNFKTVYRDYCGNKLLKIMQL